MIICISANPAIDRRLKIEKLRIGGVNRATSAQPAPGGKATHVALAARALDAEVLWVGFLGGETGAECKRALTEQGVSVEAVPTRSSTRVNQEIIERDGTITEILEPGGVIEAEEIRAMLTVCENLFDRYQKQAQVVISGSLPPGVGLDFYPHLIKLAHEFGNRVLLDTSGNALTNALTAAPDLIKPNREEAAAVLGYAIDDAGAALLAARRFIESGAQSVALSLGADGLLWLANADAKPLLLCPPEVAAHSTVGCGDTTLAGFAVALANGQNDPLAQAVLGVACGTANCLAAAPGVISRQEVMRLMPRIKIDYATAAEVRMK